MKTEKRNCWEFLLCERQPGGRLADEFGICPAATCKDLNGTHDGTNAGRACWVVAGTFCGGVVQGSELQKQDLCWKCEFFVKVRREQNMTPKGFSPTSVGMKLPLCFPPAR